MSALRDVGEFAVDRRDAGLDLLEGEASLLVGSRRRFFGPRFAPKKRAASLPPLEIVEMRGP